MLIGFESFKGDNYIFKFQRGNLRKIMLSCDGY